MKKKVHLMLLGFMAFATVAMAQETSPAFANAFDRGNMKELAGYLGDKVEINLLEEVKEFGREEAAAFLTDFYDSYRVSGFTVSHQGNRNESGFVVGNLSTASGKKFRINVFFKRKDSQCLIHQIRIDKTNE